jgi:predicted nucleic acid-binding protein
MACLDTTVVLDLMGRAGRRRQAEAEAKLRQLEHDRPHAITRFTFAELFIGVELADDPEGERARLSRCLSPLQILEFDARASRIYAAVFVHLQRLGRLPGIMDMLIGAVSLAHGQRFVTRNARHFRLIPGLRVEGY